MLQTLLLSISTIFLISSCKTIPEKDGAEAGPPMIPSPAPQVGSTSPQPPSSPTTPQTTQTPRPQVATPTPSQSVTPSTQPAPTPAPAPSPAPLQPPTSSTNQPPSSLTRIKSLSDKDRTRLMAAASAAAYCGEDVGCSVEESFKRASATINNPYPLDGWKTSFISAKDGALDVEGHVFHRPDAEDVIVAFRGTEQNLSQGGLTEWLSVNARANSKYYKGPKVSGQVHEGFLEAMYGVWHPNNTGLIRVMNDHNLRGKSFWVTGHSQGAALGVLIGMRLSDDNLRVLGIHVFGMPRLAGWDFQDSFNKQFGSITFVITNQNDPIPHIPAQFTSVGTNIQIWPSKMQLLGKDGVAPWDLITAGLNGTPTHHSLTDRQQGYMSGL